MRTFVNSQIESKGKEFDFYWRDMAEKILEQEEQIENLEEEINNLGIKEVEE